MSTQLIVIAAGLAVMSALFGLWRHTCSRLTDALDTLDATRTELTVARGTLAARTEEYNRYVAASQQLANQRERDEDTILSAPPEDDGSLVRYCPTRWRGIVHDSPLPPVPPMSVTPLMGGTNDGSQWWSPNRPDASHHHGLSRASPIRHRPGGTGATGHPGRVRSGTGNTQRAPSSTVRHRAGTTCPSRQYPACGRAVHRALVYLGRNGLGLCSGSAGIGHGRWA